MRGSGIPDGRYGAHSAQVGDLRVPSGDAPWPVAVLIHGGFWRVRYDRGLMDALAEDLVDAGWASWNLEYRRLGDGGGWPATFVDVAAGIDHLRELANGVALDLTTVVAIGHSAGGHLALWAASRPSLPRGSPGAAPGVRVSGVVAQAAVASPREAARVGLSGGAAAELLGGSPEHVPERWNVASPSEHLPFSVPQLLVHGLADELVPVELSRAHAAAATEAGDEVELVVLPGVGHFEHLDPRSEAWAVVRRWLAR